CLTAPIAAFVEWLWLGTTLNPLQIACIVIILLGVGVALSSVEHLEISRSRLTVGILFALLGAAGNAVGAVMSRKAYAFAKENGETLDGGTAAFQRILAGLLVSAAI